MDGGARTAPLSGAGRGRAARGRTGRALLPRGGREPGRRLRRAGNGASTQRRDLQQAQPAAAFHFRRSRRVPLPRRTGFWRYPVRTERFQQGTKQKHRLRFGALTAALALPSSLRWRRCSPSPHPLSPKPAHIARLPFIQSPQSSEKKE